MCWRLNRTYVLFSNPLTGQGANFLSEVKFESSPNNVLVLEDDRGVFVRAFGRGGFYEDIVVCE